VKAVAPRSPSEPGWLFARVRRVGRAARRQVGASDLRLARRLKLLSWALEIAGRLTLHWLPGPWGFIAGTLALGYHFSLEAQLNHSVMHGAYVGLPHAGRLVPSRYETLALPFQSKTWGEVHRIHHVHPSLLGLDPDTVHPLTRVHRDDPWRPWHLLNPILGFVLVFECWAFDYDRFLKRSGRRSPNDKSELWKLVGYLAYNFVFFAVLAGERWWVVASGVLVAVLLRNMSFVVLQTGSSVGQEVCTLHDRRVGPKHGDAWVRFQVETSKNFVLPRIWHAACGGLDRHIEHHLFPHLPPNRLHALSAEVRRLCQARGIVYREFPSVWSSLWDSARHLGSMALPRRHLTPEE
jgi:linoleoyl-CoA desaturase